MMIAPALILIAISTPAVDTVDTAPAKQEPAQAVEMFAVDDIDGNRFRLARYIGPNAASPRAAVLFAFADLEQDDCVRELYQLRKLDAEWLEAGLEIVHVGLGIGAKPMRRFARENNIVWRALPDASGRIAKSLGVDEAPHIVLVGRDRTIGYRSSNYSVTRYAELRRALSEVIGREAPWGEKSRPLALDQPSRTYSFGRLPSDPGAATRWQPLARLLGEATHSRVSMETTDDYDSFEAKLAAGEYEIANVGPTLAFKVLDRYEPLVTLQRRNKKSYHGILFASQASGIGSVADLKGKTLALVSEHSSSGGVFAVAELLKAGLRPEVDVHLLWAGSHEATAAAVKSGRADQPWRRRQH